MLAAAFVVIFIGTCAGADACGVLVTHVIIFAAPPPRSLLVVRHPPYKSRM